jgi:hypothetical protein
MAGLLATRVLADFFERVTLIERDAPSDAPDTRVYGDFLRVLNLLDSPAVLFRPATFWRVLQANLPG